MVSSRVLVLALLATGPLAEATGPTSQPTTLPVGPLAGLPSLPGPHVAKISTLGDNQWLSIGSPAADTKWGKARGRAWAAHMPYAPELRAAFLTGEGVHGWMNPETSRYMDDLFAYDINGHRWICLHPGTDCRNVTMKLDDEGYEVDATGQRVPLAQLAHSFEQVTYDTERKRFMFMPRPTGDWRPRFAERRSTWRKDRHPGDAGAVINSSPWMYNTLTGRFEIFRAAPPCPAYGSADVAVYVPSVKKLFYWYGGPRAWLYDAGANKWEQISPKGPPPPFGTDASACLDMKRDRIYFGGGYYPVATGPNAFWCYDVKTNEWLDLKPAGRPAKGCNRFGPNNAILNYDSASDVVVMFYHRGPIADTDGPREPGSRARGVYVYDPAANAWAEQALELHKDIAMCPSGFYSPDLNAHFMHVAQDSRDNGTMWIYRYKKPAEK